MVTARSYSNSNSGADDIQKTNQKLISHSFEAGKNYSQKEGGTHCGVFLTNRQCLPFACLMPTCSQVDGRVRLPGDQKALKSTQMHGSITSFTPKVNMATPSVLMHIRGNIRGHLLNLWFNVGFKDAQQTDLHFDRTPTDAFFFPSIWASRFSPSTGCAQAPCMGCASKVQHPMFEEPGSTYDEAPSIGDHMFSLLNACFCIHLPGREYQAPLLRTR